MESTIRPGKDETEGLLWLREFMMELNTQDNRATATPYYYELLYEDNETGERYKRLGSHGTVFFTQKAADEYIKTNHYNLPDTVYAFLAWGGRNPELKKLLESIGKVVGVPYERK